VKQNVAQPISILIVDDNPAVRDALNCIIAAQADMKVVGTASNGLEALDQVESLAPAVVLIDVCMPRMNGLEATRRITERLPEIKVLCLANHATYIDAALDAGARGYLLKGCETWELLGMIRDMKMPGMEPATTNG